LSTGSTVSLPKLAICIAAGAAVWLSPHPDGLSAAGWHVFAVFVGVISGFLLRPLDMAPCVLIGILVLVLTKTVALKEITTNGFGNTTVWLVVLAFLIADAVEHIGLGRRIALIFLVVLGRSLLGLAYAIAATELVLAPFIPSNTARGGGIVAPIVRSLAETLGSKPDENPQQGGAYLVQFGAHANLVTSAMFLTAMAGNVQVSAAAKTHLGFELTFAHWLQGSIVPGLASLAFLPMVVRLVERPGHVDVAGARSKVRETLQALGAWSPQEKKLAFLLVGLLLAWSLQSTYKTTTVALAGVLALILCGIRNWRDLATCHRAWDALIWLGGFVGLAAALESTGVTSWLATTMEARVDGLGPVTIAVTLALVYFVSMYLFTQLTAHIIALAGTFFTVAVSAGAPTELMVALIAYFSCLCGTTTPWSSGPVIIYFGQGYTSTGRWMRNGLVVAIYQLGIWLTVGMAWWRFLGWW
jgi:DASS family divalent anion:Na+ symporter